MRLNVFIAQQTGLSRRASDALVERGEVRVNGQVAQLGTSLKPNDKVTIAKDKYTYNDLAPQHTTIMLNKPVGYVCSREGQGSRTVYDLLPRRYHRLKPIGRLDKDSSGLLLLTDDGQLANQLTHPRYQKHKIYEVSLDKPLEPLHQQMISEHGIQLDDGTSKFALYKLDDQGKRLKIQMSEGRNRQIRRTFAALGYKVTRLHRIQFGNFRLRALKSAKYQPQTTNPL